MRLVTESQVHLLFFSGQVKWVTYLLYLFFSYIFFTVTEYLRCFKEINLFTEYWLWVNTDSQSRGCWYESHIEVRVPRDYLQSKLLTLVPVWIQETIKIDKCTLKEYITVKLLVDSSFPQSTETLWPQCRIFFFKDSNHV